MVAFVYQQETNIFLNRYVKGIVFIPTYLAVVLVFSQANMVLMLVVMWFALYVTDKMYYWIFNRNFSVSKCSVIYIVILLCQLVPLVILYVSNK